MTIAEKHTILRKYLMRNKSEVADGLRYLRTPNRIYYKSYRALIKGIRNLDLYSRKTPASAFILTINKIAKEEGL